VIGIGKILSLIESASRSDQLIMDNVALSK
jgi:hypothetical protein